MSKRIGCLALAGLLLITLAAVAYGYDAKPKGKLEVIVAASDSPDFIKEWVSSNFTHAPRVPRINKVKRNQLLCVAAIVSGFGTDANGMIEIEGDFVVLRPDGTELFNEKNAFGQKRKMKHSGGFLMADPAIDIVFDDKDPLGTYVIRPVVRDKVLNTTASSEYKIELIDNTGNKPLKSIFKSPNDFDRWMTYYYVSPDPEKAPAALQLYADSPLFEHANARLPMCAFFAAIFKNNGDLMAKAYTDISSNGSDNAKLILARSLWLINDAQAKELIYKASLEWKPDRFSRIFKDILANPPANVLTAPVKTPLQLDMLWSIFMATGDKQAIKQIISVLHLVKDGHGEDIMLGGAAQWSLRSNCVQHILVYKICEEELISADGQTKALLQDIITKADAEREKKKGDR